MKDAVFDEAFNFVLDTETREYTNDPRDSGGPTKFGVTLRAYASFVGWQVTPEEIRNLTEDQAKAFYFRRYWHPLRCDRITRLTVAICLFDSGVLYGVGTATLMAQETAVLCGGPVLKFDGVIGDKSIAAINSIEEELFIETFYRQLILRIDLVVSKYPKNAVFRDGWTNRAKRLLTLSGANPLNKKDA